MHRNFYSLRWKQIFLYFLGWLLTSGLRAQDFVFSPVDGREALSEEQIRNITQLPGRFRPRMDRHRSGTFLPGTGRPHPTLPARGRYLFFPGAG
ncbi:hypothetical protein V9K67_12855 [Paraflavisolibacter sp. H34]|uniref:hypothetical protein n=1 Tax=Huijunlia imazamoxiresistens TaxID=3127457 RepID=UPI00301786EE